MCAGGVTRGGSFAALRMTSFAQDDITRESRGIQNRQPPFCHNARRMAQALLITTLLTIAGLIASSVFGFRAQPGADVGNHILYALLTVILGLFSQSMTMFFFIGTGKEIKDKARGEQDEAGVVAQTRSFKSRVFPAALYAMLTIMVTFILGGGVHRGSLPVWSHQLLSLASIIMFARAYWIEIRAMDENARLMERFLRE